MIKKMLEQKQISADRLAKDTGIPYSTVNKLVNEEIDMGNITVETLNRIAKYFSMTMDMLYNGNFDADKLYVSNEGRNIIINYKNKRIQYMGPKNLIKFNHINKVYNGVLYVDTTFSDGENGTYEEEEYIDLIDVCDEYDLMLDKNMMPEIELRYEEILSAGYLIENSLMVSDYMAICVSDNSTEDVCLHIYNTKRIHLQIMLRLKDMVVLSTNMSPNMQKRAISAARRNEELIVEMIQEGRYA